MSARRRGWCPDLYRPMESGDGLLLRVRPRAATLTAAQARGLDAAAAAHGNGIVELTGRGNLQCRGFRPEGAAAFARRMVGLGLAEADPIVERRLRIVAAPLIGAEDARLAALEAALATDATLDGLAEKFVFRVEGGAIGIGDVAADIALGTGWIEAAATRFRSDDPVGDALALARRFARLGVARMRELDGGALRALAGLPEMAAAPEASARETAIGALASGCGVAPPLGQFGPGALGRLADAVATGGGDATLRITPWRSVILPGVGAGFLDVARGLGMVTAPDDPLLRIRACIGAPGCASGEAPARAVANEFLALVPDAGVLHISGCDKLCAHPRPAAVTLVGRGGVLRRVGGEAA